MRDLGATQGGVRESAPRRLSEFDAALSRCSDIRGVEAALQLLVPGEADCCVVDLLGVAGGDGAISLTVAASEALIDELADRRRATARAARETITTGAPRQVDGAVVVPLRAGGTVLGAMRWISAATRDPHELHRAELFAGSLARAVAAVRTAGRHADRVQQTALLDAIFASLPVALGMWDTDRRFVRLNEALARMNRAPVAAHLGRTLHEVVGEGAEPVDAALRQVLRTGEPVRDLELIVGSQRGGEFAAYLSSFAPVVVGGEIVGVAGTAFDITERHLADQQIQVLHERAEQQVALLDAIYESAGVGLVLFDADLRYARVNDELAQVDGIGPAEHIGRRTADVVSGELSRCLDTLVRHVLRSGEPMTGVDVSGRTPAQAGRMHHWLASFTPVEVEGERTGVLGALVDVTARREAERARERALRRVKFLNRAGELLDQAADVRQALRELADLAIPAVADGCVVHVTLEPERPESLVACSREGRDGHAVLAELGRRWPWPAAEAEDLGSARFPEPLLVAEVGDAALDRLASGPEHRALLAGLGLQSVIVCPLIARGEVIGTLAVVTGRGRALGRNDLDLVAELGRRVGLGIVNIRLLERHREIAHELQARLLPRAIPEITGADVAVRYRAAGDVNEVGGDFYDVVSSGDDRWVLIVGDVEGKGASAAALTALVRHTLRSALQHGSGLTGALDRALDELVNEAPDRSCTVALVEITRAVSGGFDLRVALAGHEQPLVRRADGTLSPVGRLGTLLLTGIPQAHHVEASHLAPGDVLLLYTDGALDAARPADGWGEAELHALLRDVEARDAAEIAEAVERAAVSAAGGRPRDDMALVAVRVLG